MTQFEAGTPFKVLQPEHRWVVRGVRSAQQEDWRQETDEGLLHAGILTARQLHRSAHLAEPR